MAKTEMRVAGFGGQGVILCGMIIGRAASIYDGRHATLIQAFGPEARGSACSAQVTIADEVVAYPYVKHPDLLIVMSPDAYKVFAPQVKPGGMILYERDMIATGPARDGIRMLGVPAGRFAEEIGRRMIMNIVMAGFFASVTGLVTRDAIEKAVRDSVPKGTEEVNLAAFQKGFEYGAQQAASPEGVR
jgi:2-oxoglutarate ferredoxin oxidoreductase subunit gamma